MLKLTQSSAHTVQVIPGLLTIRLIMQRFDEMGKTSDQRRFQAQKCTIKVTAKPIERKKSRNVSTLRPFNN